MSQILSIIAILSPIAGFVLTLVELTLAVRRLLGHNKQTDPLEGILLPWMATRKYVAPPTVRHQTTSTAQFLRLAPWLLGLVNFVLTPAGLLASWFLSTGSRAGDFLVLLALFALWLGANGVILLGVLIARKP